MKVMAYVNALLQHPPEAKWGKP